MKGLLPSILRSASFAVAFRSHLNHCHRTRNSLLSSIPFCTNNVQSQQKSSTTSLFLQRTIELRAGDTRRSSSTSLNNSKDQESRNEENTMSVTNNDEYVLPKVWQNVQSGGKFASTNRPVSGATHEKELPVGKHPLQLYSMGTPNGVKVTIMLEELLEAGVKEAEYDAWLIKIDGAQFGSGFVEINPNSKIPALVDHTPFGGSQEPLRVFESGSILTYLAEKYKQFLPMDWRHKTECMNWLMWQMGSAPFVGGGFGHFFAYAPFKMEYPINRYTMETKRQLDVLDKHLAKNRYMAGDTYTIADMAIWSWYGQLALGKLYDGSFQFLDVPSYPHLIRWADMIWQRPAVRRGCMVNKTWGPPEGQLRERHAASDFETQTEDKKQSS